MRHLQLKFVMVACTATLFLATILLNEMLFTRLEFVPGINIIYLPAGVRLLSVLLFAEARPELGILPTTPGADIALQILLPFVVGQFALTLREAGPGFSA